MAYSRAIRKPGADSLSLKSEAGRNIAQLDKLWHRTQPKGV
jgi:hypothetical protein